MTLIISNVLLVIIDSDPWFKTGAGTQFHRFYIDFEIFSVIVFSVEYLSRLWCCVEAPNHRTRLRWALSPLALLDLFCIAPFIVDLCTPPEDNTARGATLVRLLRVFSLLRMERTLKSLQTIGAVLSLKSEELFVAAFIGIIMLVVSSSLMYYIENPSGTSTETKFTSIAAAMWWSVAALTTTGYGDFTPMSAGGRVLGGLVGFVGIGIFALPAGSALTCIERATDRRAIRTAVC